MSNFFILRLSSDDERRLQIVHSLKQNINESTVSDICQNAYISKRVFYSLFSSKFEISRWYKELICTHTIDRIGEDLDWNEAYEILFSLISEERRYILLSANSSHLGMPSSPHSIGETKKWVSDRTCCLQSALKNRGHDLSDELLIYCTKIHPHIESLAIRSFLCSTNSDPITAARGLTACVPHMLYKALEHKPR